MPLTTMRHGETYRLQGRIDEEADFSAITAVGGRLALDLGGVTAINSRGVPVFQAFVDSWGDSRVEYLACSTVVLDSLIMLPLLLGPEENTARILSFHCLYSCDKCQQDEPRLVQAAELTWKGRDLCLPEQLCSACRGPLLPADLARDLEDLWQLGALPVAGRRT